MLLRCKFLGLASGEQVSKRFTSYSPGRTSCSETRCSRPCRDATWVQCYDFFKYFCQKIENNRAILNQISVINIVKNDHNIGRLSRKSPIFRRKLNQIVKSNFDQNFRTKFYKGQM
jgi:hypothetical protein